MEQLHALGLHIGRVNELKATSINNYNDAGVTYSEMTAVILCPADDLDEGDQDVEVVIATLPHQQSPKHLQIKVHKQGFKNGEIMRL